MNLKKLSLIALVSVSVAPNIHALSNPLNEAFIAHQGIGKVEKLITESNVEINNDNSVNKMTALHWAARRGTVQEVQLLLQYGANSKLETTNGNTALDLAKERLEQEQSKQGKKRKKSEIEQTKAIVLLLTDDMLVAKVTI